MKIVWEFLDIGSAVVSSALIPEERCLVGVASGNVCDKMVDQVYSRRYLILNMRRFLGERHWKGKYQCLPIGLYWLISDTSDKRLINWTCGNGSGKGPLNDINGDVGEFLGTHDCSTSCDGHGCSGNGIGSSREMAPHRRETLVMVEQFDLWGHPSNRQWSTYLRPHRLRQTQRQWCWLERKWSVRGYYSRPWRTVLGSWICIGVLWIRLNVYVIFLYSVWSW